MIGFGQQWSIAQLWQYTGTARLKTEQDLKISIARQDKAIAQSQVLPVLYGDANLQNNLIIPTTPVPSIAFDPNASPDAITPLRFATRWSSKAGLQLEWKIFDPSRSKEISIKDHDLQIAQIEAEESLHQWRVDATLAYTAVVLAHEQNTQSREDSILYAQILASIRARVEAGRALEQEFLEAQQEMERIRIRRLEAWGVLQETSLTLRQEIPELEIQQVTSNLTEIVSFLQQYFLPNYAQLKLEQEVQRAALLYQMEKSKNLPSLNFQTYYGGQYYDNALRLSQWDQWFGHSFVALSLRIPISDHFFNRQKWQKAHNEWKLKQLDLENQKSDDALLLSQKHIKNQTFQQKHERLEEILRLAIEQEKIQRASYEAGRILLSQYHQSLLQKNQAHQQLWQNQYEWVQAIVNP